MITLVFAQAQNGVIGAGGTLPWHLPADLRRFKALTSGKPMIMGRKTFESFPAPLPGRRHIVLTRGPEWPAGGAEVARSVEQALALAGPAVSIIGGAEILRLFEHLADYAEVTVIERDYAGDTRFQLDDSGWSEDAREPYEAADGHPAYTFLTLRRSAGVAPAPPL